MLIDEQVARRVIQPRPKESHKGSYGRVLLIGGLYPYGGAIIMAALACVHSGAGLVTVATDLSNIPALHSHLPEAMAFDVTDIETLQKQIRQADVILIGPGLGESKNAERFLQLVFNGLQTHQIVIVDGSALNVLAKKKSVSWQSNKIILTPHQMEWERLSGIPILQQNEENTKEALHAFPEGTILVAKSHATKIYQGQQLAEIGVGGPYQATGGMGDTLAGMIAGFVAQFGGDLYETVAAATYLHSAIADELAKDAYVVLPTCISKEIPKWMKRFSI